VKRPFGVGIHLPDGPTAPKFKKEKEKKKILKRKKLAT
jgi:hypothetical protein